MLPEADYLEAVGDRDIAATKSTFGRSRAHLWTSLAVGAYQLANGALHISLGHRAEKLTSDECRFV